MQSVMQCISWSPKTPEKQRKRLVTTDLRSQLWSEAMSANGDAGVTSNTPPERKRDTSVLYLNSWSGTKPFHKKPSCCWDSRSYCVRNFGVASLRAPSQYRGWKLYLRVPRRALPIHLFEHFCWTMYRLTTINMVTDRRTDRQINRPHYDANSRPYLKQYDRLKTLFLVVAMRKVAGHCHVNYEEKLIHQCNSNTAWVWLSRSQYENCGHLSHDRKDLL